MLNYALLTKAINRIDKKKQQVKPKVDAAAFIEDVSAKYNTIDKYFIENPTSLLESGEIVFQDNTDLTSLDYPLSLNEMLEKL